MDGNGPRDVLRDGNLKASIFRNESDNGPFYSANLARTYTDARSGEVRDAHSFSGTELLRVSELARKAYDRTQELRREDRAETRDAPERDSGREEYDQRRGQSREPSQRPDRIR